MCIRDRHILAGVIDENYRGELQVVLINLGKETLKFEKHSRIAQLIILPYLKTEVEEVKELSETNRGSSGFGSTGLK